MKKPPSKEKQPWRFCLDDQQLCHNGFFSLLVCIAICLTTVTMQAQRSVPPDMTCNDKFLIQSTVVPAGTTDEHITTGVVGTYLHANLPIFKLVSHWFILVSSPRRKASL